MVKREMYMKRIRPFIGTEDVYKRQDYPVPVPEVPVSDFYGHADVGTEGGSDF